MALVPTSLTIDVPPSWPGPPNSHGPNVFPMHHDFRHGFSIRLRPEPGMWVTFSGSIMASVLDRLRLAAGVSSLSPPLGQHWGPEIRRWQWEIGTCLVSRLGLLDEGIDLWSVADWGPNLTALRPAYPMAIEFSPASRLSQELSLWWATASDPGNDWWLRRDPPPIEAAPIVVATLAELFPKAGFDRWLTVIRNPATPQTELSSRDKELLRLWNGGEKVAVIAHRLALEAQTVHNRIGYLRSILGEEAVPRRASRPRTRKQGGQSGSSG